MGYSQFLPGLIFIVQPKKLPESMVEMFQSDVAMEMEISCFLS